jgi:hypothetical protein
MRAALVILGLLSLVSLVFMFLALSDIQKDFASPQVFLRAGQPLPAWYVQNVNTCPLEWRVLQIGWATTLLFNLGFFINLMRRRGTA